MDNHLDIIRCTKTEIENWLALRWALWPHTSAHEHAQDIAAILQQPVQSAAFLAQAPDNRGVAFAEATLRHDYVNGCESSPVLFLEGIYVIPCYRRRGIARALCRAVEQWGLQQGCSEFASDTALLNLTGQDMHRALGFVETERVIFFRKILTM
jgi:aminoglycoside 6'-N-acetyltransferase I